MATVMLEVLNGFSLVRVLIYQHSKSAFLVVDILAQILLTLLTFIALPILRKISICRRWFLWTGVCYYM